MGGIGAAALGGYQGYGGGMGGYGASMMASPGYGTPMAAANMGGSLVVGADRNRDGIPDAMQRSPYGMGAMASPMTYGGYGGYGGGYGGGMAMASPMTYGGGYG